MALLPVILNEMLNDYRRPATIGDVYDQHFGLGLDDIVGAPSRALISLPGLSAGYLRPWRNMAAGDSGVSSFKSDDKEFSVRLDVSHFKPEELNVKLDDNGFVVVDGKHEERSDEHGFITRQFTRKYKLPENVIVDTLSSNLSTDGVLTLQAAKKPSATETGRAIKITRTNQPALKNNGEHQAAAVEAKKAK